MHVVSPTLATGEVGDGNATTRPGANGGRVLVAAAGASAIRRPVAAYALVPRPQELALKPPIMILSYAAGRWASARPGPSLLSVVGLVVVVEALAYQARYVVNDLLDAGLDLDHPACGARHRLPPGTTARRWAVVSIVTRVAATVVAVAAMPSLVGTVGAAATVSIVVATALYEAVRQTLRRPAPLAVVTRLAPAVAVVYLLAGAGFLIRIAGGLAAAGIPARVLVVSAFYAVPFGILFTTMAWTLQASAFVTPDWDRLDPRLARKRQLGPLLRWAGALPRRPGGRLADPADPVDPVDTRVLAGPCSYRAVWTVAALAGAVGAAALGTVLASRSGDGRIRPWAVGAIVVACVVGTGATLRRAQTPTSTPAAARAGATAVTVIALTASGRAALPWLAALPIGGMLATAVVMRSLTYRRMVGLRPCRPGLGGPGAGDDHERIRLMHGAGAARDGRSQHGP